MGNTTRTHWEDVYQRVPTDQVSWYQPEPAVSLELLAAAGTGRHDPVVDVGGGASVLVDRLLAAGYDDLTVLDAADRALRTACDRLGPAAGSVRWLATDLLGWTPPRRYRLWHDRAVFHFLTDPAQRDRYRRVLAAALADGGHAILGTFAADGPTACSGLPVTRYGPDELAAEFADLRVVRATREEHHTPAGGTQPFTWLLLERPAG